MCKNIKNQKVDYLISREEQKRVGVEKMECRLTEREAKVNPGQQVEVKWFERDGTYSGIGEVHEVTPSCVKVVLRKVLSGGSSYKAGSEVKVPRYQDHTGGTLLNSVRLIEEKAFKHKDFL